VLPRRAVVGLTDVVLGRVDNLFKALGESVCGAFIRFTLVSRAFGPGAEPGSARGRRRRFADAPDGTPSKLSGRRSGLARESSIGPGRVGPVVAPLGNSPLIQ